MFRFWRKFRGRYRRIFRFDNGAGLRRIDPLIVAQRLALDEHYLPDHLSAAEAGDPIAQAIVAGCACRAFGVTPYDDRNETGLTTSERIDLMISYDNYLLALKKNTRTLPTAPPPTDAIQAASSGETTNASSAYGPTGTARHSEPPSQSGLAR